MLLAEVLTDGDASRLQRRLVQRDQTVTDVAAYLGEFGDPFDERDPSIFNLTRALSGRRLARRRSSRAIDEELDRVATDGLEPRRTRPRSSFASAASCCANSTR